MERAYRFEGLVAKRVDSAYEPGLRSGAWLKMRINPSQEFVIGGYTPSHKNFDALIFGYYEGDRLRSPHSQRLHPSLAGNSFYNRIATIGQSMGRDRSGFCAPSALGLWLA